MKMKRLLLFRYNDKKCKNTAHDERCLLDYSYICIVAEGLRQT